MGSAGGCGAWHWGCAGARCMQAHNQAGAGLVAHVHGKSGSPRANCASQHRPHRMALAPPHQGRPLGGTPQQKWVSLPFLFVSLPFNFFVFGPGPQHTWHQGLDFPRAPSTPAAWPESKGSPSWNLPRRAAMRMRLGR